MTRPSRRKPRRRSQWRYVGESFPEPFVDVLARKDRRDRPFVARLCHNGWWSGHDKLDDNAAPLYWTPIPRFRMSEVHR